MNMRGIFAANLLIRPAELPTSENRWTPQVAGGRSGPLHKDENLCSEIGSMDALSMLKLGCGPTVS
jgi:hypothetical protein